MIEQITVFLENDKGRLAALCRVMGDAQISMHALTVADTSQYGVVRIIADTPAKAYEILSEQGFRVSLTKVIAVEVSDAAGSLADMLEILGEENVNVEYAYCFSVAGDKAVDVLRVSDPETARVALEKSDFRLLGPEELYVN